MEGFLAKNVLCTRAARAHVRAPKKLLFWDLFGARARRLRRKHLREDRFHAEDPFERTCCWLHVALLSMCGEDKESKSYKNMICFLFWISHWPWY